MRMKRCDMCKVIRKAPGIEVLCHGWLFLELLCVSVELGSLSSRLREKELSANGLFGRLYQESPTGEWGSETGKESMVQLSPIGASGK